MDAKPLVKPPEGVLAGEDVPMENQRDSIDESEIESVMSYLKMRGSPYTEMDEDELREKAIEKIEVM